MLLKIILRQIPRSDFFFQVFVLGFFLEHFEQKVQKSEFLLKKGHFWHFMIKIFKIRPKLRIGENPL